MEAVVTTDWHLDVLRNIFHNNPEQGIKLQIKDIEKVFTYATENGIRNVIVPGDIGQTEELSAIAKFHFLNLLMKYDGILKIHIIPGNHDYTKVGVHSLKLLELLCVKQKFKTIFLHVEGTKVDIDGETFNFLPFPLVVGDPNCINVAHLEVKGACRDNGRKVTNGHEISESPWIIGHLHTYQVVKNAVMPGTLFQCNFGEKLPKGFIHIKVKDGKLKHRFINNNPSFTFNTLEVTDFEDWSKISKKETDFLRIYINSSVTIPDEIYNYSNVLQISGKIIENSEEKEDLASDSLKVLDDEEEILPNHLATTYRFNKGQIKRSMDLVNRAKAQVQGGHHS